MPHTSALTRVQFWNGGVQKAGHGHHEPALVPDAHHHVGEGDLLDAAPLPLHHHHVVQADGLGEGQLDSGQGARDGLLGGQANHQAGHPGRGQDAAPNWRKVSKRMHTRAATTTTRMTPQDPVGHPHLGIQLAGLQFVLGPQVETGQEKVLGQEHPPGGQPGQGHGPGHPEQLPHPLAQARREEALHPLHDQARHEQHRHRPTRTGQALPHRIVARSAGPAHGPRQHRAHDAPDDQTQEHPGPQAQDRSQRALPCAHRILPGLGPG